MRLFLMLAACSAPATRNLALVELIDLLRRHGHQVDIGIAQEMVMDPRQSVLSYDLCILKSHSNLWLSLAGAMHQQGARLLNPYPACVAVHNKIVATQRMQAANIPIPDTWITGDLNLLRELLKRTPLVIKPYIGGRGANVHFVHKLDELLAIPQPQEPVLAQEFIPGDGEDLKLYVIRDQVFAVRKPFSPSSYQIPGMPCTVSPLMRHIALECGKAFGLELYGLDVIEGPDGPRVVDLNYFPSYRGVPGAAELLAEHIESYAYGRYPHWVFDASAVAPAMAGDPIERLGPLL